MSVDRDHFPALLAEAQRRAAYKIRGYFNDTNRAGYAKHLALMKAGATYPLRMFLAANRVGKTDCGAYETTCHLTGDYPAWWTGRKFEGSVEAWAAGDTSMTTRDIIQVALLGPTGNLETKNWAGMLPAHRIVDFSRRTGVQDAVETIWVQQDEREHGAPCVSVLNLKSYDQRRQAFQGTAKHLVWLDEEPPADIFGESLMRIMTTAGLLLVTLTPLQGLTQFVNDWLDRSVLEVLDADGASQLEHAKSAVFKSDSATSGKAPDLSTMTRYTVMAGWDDAPHLGVEAKKRMRLEYQPAQLAARSQGIPALGSGAIYPIPEDEVRIHPFEIPSHWPRCFALDTSSDVGWTAAVWLAFDRETQTVYLYDAYKRQHAEPSMHAASIKARGDWIPGVGDAAGILVTNHDSEQFIKLYRRLGLDITLPDKSVETGIQEVWELLSAGRLRVFATCGAWFDEYRLYRRDEHGRIIKKNDHLMDASRYGIRSGLKRAIVKPRKSTGDQGTGYSANINPADAWMS